jgi:hypothetical protein
MSESKVEVKSPDQEAFIELGFKRGYNLGKYGDIKEYTMKISGNQSIVEDQLKNHRNRLTKYVVEMESLVEEANKVNLARLEAERVLAAATTTESNPQ